MRHKICAVLLSVVLGFGVFLTSLSVITFASVSSSVWEFLAGYLLEKGIDSFVNSPYTTEHKFELLTALRDFCKENNIDPNSDDFGDFLVFAMLEAPDDSYGDYTAAYGENWVDLHKTVYSYMGPISTVYQMAWVDVQKWIIEHFDDVSTGFDEKGNVQIPIEDFKQEIKKQNNTITPKNRNMLKYSWRDLSDNQKNVDVRTFARGVFKDGVSCVDTSFEDGIYIQMYMRREGYMYYHPYQFKIYRTKESLGGHSPIYKYEWHVQPIYYETLDGVSLDTFDTVALTIEKTLNSDGEITSLDCSDWSLGMGDRKSVV